MCCRSCGGVFCSECSNHLAAVPKEQCHDPVRVCRTCYASLHGPGHQSVGGDIPSTRGCTTPTNGTPRAMPCNKAPLDGSSRPCRTTDNGTVSCRAAASSKVNWRLRNSCRCASASTAGEERGRVVTILGCDKNNYFLSCGSGEQTSWHITMPHHSIFCNAKQLSKELKVSLSSPSLPSSNFVSSTTKKRPKDSSSCLEKFRCMLCGVGLVGVRNSLFHSCSIPPSVISAGDRSLVTPAPISSTPRVVPTTPILKLKKNAPNRKKITEKFLEKPPCDISGKETVGEDSVPAKLSAPIVTFEDPVPPSRSGLRPPKETPDDLVLVHQHCCRDFVSRYRVSNQCRVSSKV